MSGAVSGAAAGASSGSLAGPIGTAVGAIGGAAIGAFSANAQSKKSYKYARKLQEQAAKLNYDYSLKSAENLPSSTRLGLESAGYNPMLAVQNSTQGANSSWTSATKADVADVSSAMSAGVANAHSVQRLKNETQQAESSSDAYYAAADKSKAEKAEITARLPFVSRRQKAEIAQIEADAQLLEAKKHYLSEDIAVRQAGLTIQQEANAIERETRSSGRSQSFRNYTDGVRNIFSGIGDIIHGRNDNYENYTETREVTNGPKGRSQEKVTSKRSGRRKKR